MFFESLSCFVYHSSDPPFVKEGRGGGGGVNFNYLLQKGESENFLKKFNFFKV